MHEFASNAFYGRFADHPPKAGLWNGSQRVFAVDMACKTSGEPLLIICPSKLRRVLPLALRKGFDRYRESHAVESANDRLAKCSERSLNHHIILVCEGRKFRFHRYDPMTDSLIFWPVPRGSRPARRAAARLRRAEHPSAIALRASDALPKHQAIKHQSHSEPA